MLPSVSELTYFFEVATTLNLSRAAKKLCVSQPSLSRAMQQLEATIGTSLLIRHSNGVALTPAGKQLHSQIKPLLQHWHHTKMNAQAANQTIVGDIKIGCLTTIGLYLHNLLLELLKDYPQLNVELTHAASDTISQKVIDLQLDVGIVTNPIQCPDLIIRKICEIESTLWVGSGNHSFQSMNSDSSILIYNPESNYSKMMLQKCKERNIQFNRMIKVNNFEVIANLTAHGCGIGILPSCFSQSVYMKQLTRVEGAPEINDEIYLIYRKEYLNISTVNAVVTSIKEISKKRLALVSASRCRVA